MKVDRYIKEQEELKNKIVLKNMLPKKIKMVAGVDQAFVGRDKIISGIVVLSYPDLEVLEEKNTVNKVNFPYISGLLSYREGPSIIRAYKKLKIKPDILMVDGQGTAHPRGIGIASHIGVLLNIPTIGVAKSRLVGDYDKRKRCAKLMFEGKCVGYVLKTSKRPIFISPGHKISMRKSLEIVKKCLRDYRLPEPTRLAHLYVNKVKRNVC